MRIKIEPGVETKGCSGCVTRGDDRHRPGCSQDANWDRKPSGKQEVPNEVTFDHDDRQPRRENSKTNHPMVKQEFPNETIFNHSAEHQRQENERTNWPMVKQERDDDWL